MKLFCSMNFCVLINFKALEVLDSSNLLSTGKGKAVLVI